MLPSFCHSSRNRTFDIASDGKCAHACMHATTCMRRVSCHTMCRTCLASNAFRPFYDLDRRGNVAAHLQVRSICRWHDDLAGVALCYESDCPTDWATLLLYFTHCVSTRRVPL